MFTQRRLVTPKEWILGFVKAMKESLANLKSQPVKLKHRPGEGRRKGNLKRGRGLRGVKGSVLMWRL